VASHYPTLDFGAVARGYTAGWSTGQLCELGWSLEPVAIAVAEVTTVEWVKEARRVEREATRGRGGVQSAEAGPSAAPAEPHLDQGDPLVGPATRLLSSVSSANTDEAPQ
jgi:hypothetical protein